MDKKIEDKYNLYLEYLNASNKVDEKDKNIILQNLRNIIAHNSNKFLVADEFDIMIYSYLQRYKEKEILSTNLKHYMDMRGLNVTELANKIGLPYSTVNDWVNAVSYPRVDKLNMLAEAFGVSKKDLTEAHDDLYTPSYNLGIPAKYIEYFEHWDDIPYKLDNITKNYIAVKIEDDSMNDKYVKNDTVIFERTKECKNR